MDVASRPPVLDTGVEAIKHCIQSGVASINGVNIAYDVYALGRQQDVQVGAGVEPVPSTSVGTDKVIMIMGFAAAGNAWLPTLRNLFARGEKVSGLEVLVFDNRGIGRSSCPAPKTLYTTDIMAADALGLMDQLSWRRAHVVGHSMGAMVACRLALAAPDRVASLTLVSVTGGGSEALPLNWRALRAVFRGALRTQDDLSRARTDISFHFSPKLLALKDPLTGRAVRDLLVEEYVATSKQLGRQPKHGQDGHMHAVFKHGLSGAERRRLADAGFPIKVIHGCDDIVAEPRHAARMARQLRAPLVLLDSGHFTPRDSAEEVNDELLASIDAVRRGIKHADAVHVCHEPRLYDRHGCACCF